MYSGPQSPERQDSRHMQRDRKQYADVACSVCQGFFFKGDMNGLISRNRFKHFRQAMRYLKRMVACDNLLSSVTALSPLL